MVAFSQPLLVTHSQLAKTSLAVVSFNVLVVFVFGSQNLSTYLQSTASLSFPLGVLCFILAPLLCVEAFYHQNVSGHSWHERYGDSPVGGVLLGVYYACFWSFAVHAAILISTWQCDICTGNPASGTGYFTVAYWLHVFPSLVIAIASPLQFTPSIRKLRGYSVHRWIGRLILLASVMHQASATVLFVSELFFSKVDCALVDPAEVGQCGWLYRIYVAGFVPKNLLAWAAIVMGYLTARRKRFAEHGRWMYRLAAMWIITIVVAHIIIYPVGFAVGPQYKYAIGEWTEWLFVVPMEAYIRRSGRFLLPHDSKLQSIDESLAQV